MTFRILNLLALCLLWGSAFSQSTQCIEDRYSGDPLFSDNQISVHYNVEYGTAVHYWTGQNTSLLMDVYEPDPAADPIDVRPFVLLIHGGSFISGNKSDMASMCMELAKRGFVAATMSYRLGWDCDYTNPIALGGSDCFGLCNACYVSNLYKGIYMAVQDAHAAMRFATHHQATYGIDSNWMFVGGASAGGITSLLLSTWSQNEAQSIVGAPFANEVGDLDDSGNSFTDTFIIKGVINHCGAVLNPDHLDNNSNLPIVSFHDSNDIVVPYGSGPVGLFLAQFGYFYGSSVIHAERLNAGECSELHTVPNSLNHCSYPAQNLAELATCFLKRVMCGVCVSYSSTDVNEPAICNALASVDTGTAGCTYANATNYNPLATVDNGSCLFPDGCPTDINQDGYTNITDLLIFVAYYGTNCP